MWLLGSGWVWARNSMSVGLRGAHALHIFRNSRLWWTQWAQGGLSHYPINPSGKNRGHCRAPKAENDGNLKSDWRCMQSESQKIVSILLTRWCVMCASYVNNAVQKLTISLIASGDAHQLCASSRNHGEVII